MDDQQAKYKAKQEKLKKAREEAKAETDKGGKDAAAAGKELDARAKELGTGMADGLAKAREEAAKKWNDTKAKVAIPNMSQIEDLKANQPAEAGAAKEKAKKAQEAANAQSEMASKTVEVASPQMLESTSTAAFDKFRENVANEQKAIMEAQLKVLQRAAKALEDPNMAIVEVD